jgi:hypothetical protein
MSVSIRYLGGFGNMLFQYAYARLFAEQNGLQLESRPPDFPEFIRTTPHQVGSKFASPLVDVDESVGNLLTIGKAPNAHYNFNGFFQHGDWYIPHIEKIRHFLQPVKSSDDNMHPLDIVVHLRLRDYPFCKWISPEWYCNILKGLEFKDLYVVTDDPNPRYLKALDQFKPIVVSKSADHDWNFLRRFKRVIASNSTFCWWAVFFGAATEAFVFKRWMGSEQYHLADFPGFTLVDGPFDTEVIR